MLIKTSCAEESHCSSTSLSPVVTGRLRQWRALGREHGLGSECMLSLTQIGQDGTPLLSSVAQSGCLRSSGEGRCKREALADPGEADGNDRLQPSRLQIPATHATCLRALRCPNGRVAPTSRAGFCVSAIIPAQSPALGSLVTDHHHLQPRVCDSP